MLLNDFFKNRNRKQQEVPANIPAQQPQSQMLSHVPVVVNPFLAKFRSIPKIEEPMHFELVETEFWKITKAYIDSLDNEIAGFGYIDDENRIVWSNVAEIDASSGGHVISGSVKSEVEALSAGFGVPNLQWHTHPSMSPFFSPTDESDQMKFIEGAMRVVPNSTGNYAFMVITEFSWLISRIFWENGELVGVSRGSVSVNDIMLNCQQRIDEDLDRIRAERAAERAKNGNMGYVWNGGYAGQNSVWKKGDDGFWQLHQKVNDVADADDVLRYYGSTENDGYWEDLFYGEKDADKGINKKTLAGNEHPDFYYDDLFYIYDIEQYNWDALEKAIYPLPFRAVLDNEDLWDYLDNKGDDDYVYKSY